MYCVVFIFLIFLVERNKENYYNVNTPFTYKF